MFAFYILYERRNIDVYRTAFNTLRVGAVEAAMSLANSHFLG